MGKRSHRGLWMVVGVLLGWNIVRLVQAAVPTPLRVPGEQTTPASISDAPPLTQAFEAALLAAQLAQTADTPGAWSEVVTEWAAAIQALHAVPAQDPQWLFAQRKAREYLSNQAIAQRRAETAGAPSIFPTFGSAILDEQLGLYLSYLSIFGPPEIMVLGSSRALQGINPQLLQHELTQQEVGSPRVYTFAVNGATARVVAFVLEQLLAPSQRPRMVIWAGGSRAFNSARVDRTFSAIVESPGYAALQGGDRPGVSSDADTDAEDPAKATAIPVTAINGYGFLPVTDVFDPETYYQQFPRVSGRYDAAYQPFVLEGVQTTALRAISALTTEADIALVFVNLPLTSDYLDEVRSGFERQFQRYLQREAAAANFTVVDLLQRWPDRNDLFADPSHLNERGAAQVARLLARDAEIPWSQLLSDPNPEPPQ